VEAQIPPSDVGHLKPGQPVKVKVSAYEFSRYGNIPGTLESVSASTFQNEDKQSFYKARIRLEKNYAGNDASRNLILPGMTVQADIVTGEKTILGYLLKPIQVAMEGSFHEH
jgi:HlyD family secretion protein/adhesin transport system membrane fusion protein